MKNATGYRTRLPGDANVYEGRCPILHALDIIGGKWKLPILWHLSGQEAVRYNQLKRSVRGVTNMMLSKCLKELETVGLVVREQYDTIPPKVEYSLTPKGQELLPALKKLYTWGEGHLKNTR